MYALVSSTWWQYRVIRIVVLTTIGWWAFKNLVFAQLPDNAAWPNTNFEIRSVEMDEIQSGGPPKDGIPPLDAPTFVSGAEASGWLDPREPVIVVSIAGGTKAYPIQILTWHEIVNDEIGGTPVSVTFCPLCNATIVFDRRLDGTVYDFGTTGKLRKSDLVMYDRQTESWWQQFSGEAIVGKLTGKILRRLPASITAFRTFAKPTRTLWYFHVAPATSVPTATIPIAAMTPSTTSRSCSSIQSIRACRRWNGS